MNQDAAAASYATASLNCYYLGGMYTEDGYCYELKALKKLCVKVDLSYLGNEDPGISTIVNKVKVTTGCFVGGNVAYYASVPLSEIETPTGMHSLDFNDVPIEVRHDADPYTVFTSIATLNEADMHIFFWLSMACLFAAFILIIALATYYNLYISV